MHVVIRRPDCGPLGSEFRLNTCLIRAILILGDHVVKRPVGVQEKNGT